MRRVAIIQGEHAVVTEPGVAITTLLGSCIAVCLHDAQAHIGGMNHFLLGEPRPGQTIRATRRPGTTTPAPPDRATSSASTSCVRRPIIRPPTSSRRCPRRLPGTAAPRRASRRSTIRMTLRMTFRMTFRMTTRRTTVRKTRPAWACSTTSTSCAGC